MIHAILTMDDIASANTPAIVDYLNEKHITALMFAVGTFVEKYYDHAIYALQHGMIVGNHSYDHPHFSQLTLEQAVDEIEKNEAVLNKLYQDAGVERRYRPFRFPFGDKGGTNKEALQQYFKDHGFHKLKDSAIPYAFWKEEGFHEDLDTLWTYDFCEYNIRPGSGYTWEDALKRMQDMHPKNGAPLFGEGGHHILLLHAHDDTEAMVPEYYRRFLDQLLDKGVVFDLPEFYPAGRTV
ncbi:MAG: polysaccharide deacetylase family protein [Lachnospiraceae bacterium]|nr:polysaccharide deacetylase family protein [Lachnospiraceae bacterium]